MSLTVNSKTNVNNKLIVFGGPTPTPTPTITLTSYPTPTVTNSLTYTPTYSPSQTSTPTITNTYSPTTTSSNTPTPTKTPIICLMKNVMEGYFTDAIYTFSTKDEICNFDINNPDTVVITSNIYSTSYSIGGRIYFEENSCLNQVNAESSIHIPNLNNKYVKDNSNGLILQLTYVNVINGYGYYVISEVDYCGDRPTPTATPTNTQTPSNTPTITVTQTNTQTITNTNTVTLTNSVTLTSTVTPTITSTTTPSPLQTCYAYSAYFSVTDSCSSVCASSISDIIYSSVNNSSILNVGDKFYSSQYNCERYITGGLSNYVSYNGKCYVLNNDGEVLTISDCSTPTPTPTITNTSTLTPTPTITATSSLTLTPTKTTTPTPTITATSSLTLTPTKTTTQTPTVTTTASLTQTPTVTTTASLTQTPTATITSSLTPTPSVTPTKPPMIAIGGIKTEITVNGVDYYLHTFIENGAFEVISGEGDVDYLIVGGGGGAGGTHTNDVDLYIGGGGGGAQVISGTVLNANSTIFNGSSNVSLGAGGIKGISGDTTSTPTKGGSGGSTYIVATSTITAAGGGGGGAGYSPYNSVYNDGINGVNGASSGGGGGAVNGVGGGGLHSGGLGGATTTIGGGGGGYLGNGTNGDNGGVGGGGIDISTFIGYGVSFVVAAGGDSFAVGLQNIPNYGDGGSVNDGTIATSLIEDYEFSVLAPTKPKTPTDGGPGVVYFRYQKTS